MSDAKVEAATGKTWAQWFSVLDRAKAADMKHSDIALYLSEQQGVPPWWSQMVTVGYEQERGLRRVHEKPDGFEVGASKTLDVSLAELYRAWDDARRRAKWLPEPIEVRKATSEKSMRITWPDGTHVDAYFSTKGPSKSLIHVQHRKLATAKAAQHTKALWKSRLEALEQHFG